VREFIMDGLRRLAETPEMERKWPLPTEAVREGELKAVIQSASDRSD
jgi:hypothetical protein